MKVHLLLNSVIILVILTKNLVLGNTVNEVVAPSSGKIHTNSSDLSEDRAKLLSRRRRFVAFPEGSSFSVAFCLTVGLIGNPELDYFSWALNWGLAYDLPNQTWILTELHKKRFPKPFIQRRHRRELYDRLELAIDNMGYNGRECILRALCESAQYFYKRGSNMIEEMLRTIFYLPSLKLLPSEESDLLVYDEAHRKGKNRVFCATSYSQCSFSIIGLILGVPMQSFDYM